MNTRRCSYSECRENSNALRRRRIEGFYLDEAWFCSDLCVEQQVIHHLGRLATTSETPNRGSIPRPPMGLFLLNAGAVTKAHLDTATLFMGKSKRGTLAGWLVRLGYTSERDITRALGRQYGLPFVDLTHARIRPSVLSLLPAPVVAAGRVLPLDYDPVTKELSLAFGVHIEMKIKHVIGKMLECGINAFIGDESCIVDLIHTYYSIPLKPFETVAPALGPAVPVPELARQIVDGLRRFGSNGLTFEPYNDLIWVRYQGPERSESLFIDRYRPPVGVDKTG